MWGAYCHADVVCRCNADTRPSRSPGNPRLNEGDGRRRARPVRVKYLGDSNGGSVARHRAGDSVSSRLTSILSFYPLFSSKCILKVHSIQDIIEILQSSSGFSLARILSVNHLQRSAPYEFKDENHPSYQNHIIAPKAHNDPTIDVYFSLYVEK